MAARDPWIGPRGSGAARLLRVLREHGPMTRPDAARLTGMSVGGIRPLADDLIAAGQVVADGGERPAGRGRPGVVLRAVQPDGVVLGLDFGHNHVAAEVADLAGASLGHRRTVDVDVDHDAPAALTAAVRLARSVLRSAGRGGSSSTKDVRHVVAGLPGPVDESGRLRSSTIAASWAELDTASEIARRLRLEPGSVDIENDAHLGALGEHRAGAGRGHDDLVYVKASHGLGAGLILAGELYRGASGLTGEIGHAVVEPDGALCRCGNRGCLETVVSVERVRAQVRFVLGEQPPEVLSAAENHPAARRIVVDCGRALGRALADVCNVLNPEVVVLGGELSGGGRPLLEGVVESIRRYAQPAVADTAVVLSELGDRAQAVGATTLAATRARDRLWAAAEEELLRSGMRR